MLAYRNRIVASALHLSSLCRVLPLIASAFLVVFLLDLFYLFSLPRMPVAYLVLACQVAATMLLTCRMWAQPPGNQLVRAPAMIETGEIFFRALAEHSQVALWMARPDWRRFLYISPACAAIWGRDAALMLSDPAMFWEVLHPDDRGRMQTAMAQLGSAECSIEYRIIRPDGALRWLETRIFQVRDAAGTLSGIAGIAIDVTDRKQREEERLLQERRAQEACRQESLSVLASGIAHNFNNLLQIILGYVDLSLDTLPASAPAYRLIAPIQAAGLRGAALTRQMLAFSGRGHSLMQPLVLNDMLATVAESLRSPTNDTITMQMQLEPKLPSITGDISQIQQIVQHLVTNAVEAIGAGPGSIVVRTSLCQHAGRGSLATMAPAPDLLEGDYVMLEVADTGCGMEADTRVRMFDPFFSTKFAGRGLGLASVLGIVREHGGRILVASKPGQGTTITVLLPPTPMIEIPAGVRTREACRADRVELYEG